MLQYSKIAFCLLITKRKKLTMKPRDDLRTRRTKRWLETALRDLMKEKAYEKIRVSEIVRRAEVARPTFYLHYESKDDLLFSLFDTLFLELRRDVLEDLETQPLKLDNFSKQFFWYSQQNADDIKVLLDAGVERLVKQRFRSIAHEIIEKARRIDPINPRYTAIFPYADSFMIGGMFDLVTQWIQDDMPVPPEKMGALVSEWGKASYSVIQWPSVD